MARVIDNYYEEDPLNSRDYSEDSEDEKDGWTSCPKLGYLIGGGSCCCILLIIGILQIVCAHVAWTLVSKEQNLSNFADPHWTPHQYPRYMACGQTDLEGCGPGDKDDATIEKCSLPCFSLNYVLEWEKFAQSNPYNLVYFPSRAGPEGQAAVNISAWWLPADTSRLPAGKVPPRVVVLHGLASTNNHCGTQAACYLLRSMGFSCLTPTVRDYGLSGASEHPDILSWGYDYPLDLLGAWDYAVNDPDGVLGGPLPPEQVAIMGFSKGALVTAIAFALEKRVPGAWIDSAPIEGVTGMIDYNVRPYLGALSGILTGPMGWWANHWSGIPVDYYNPMEMLARCEPTGVPRHVLVSQSSIDNVVPTMYGKEMIMLLGGLPGCYTLETYTPPESCAGYNHHAEMNQYPETSRVFLCKFFSATFNQSTATCGLDELPEIQLPDQSPELLQKKLNDDTFKGPSPA